MQQCIRKQNTPSRKKHPAAVVWDA